MKNLISKALFIYVLFHFIAIFSCGQACNCPEIFFELEDITLESVDKSAIGNSIFDLAFVEDSTMISTTNFGIALFLETKKCSHFQMPDFSSFFVQSALACDCGGTIPCDNMTLFNIRSDADMVFSDGTIKKAGESLNAVFDVSFAQNDFTAGSLDAYLNNLHSLMNEEAVHIFSLNRPLEGTQTHTFTAELEIDNGSRFSNVAATVIFE